ncbi:MAG: zinc ribbon domain-containing protein [Candidatus Hodarchaeota archaeon]
MISDDKGNQKLHAWSFHQFSQLLAYKAEAVGIRLEYVSERNTSQTCVVCGQKGVRVKRGLFKCLNKKCAAYDTLRMLISMALKQVSPTGLAGSGGGSGWFGPPLGKALELAHLGFLYVAVEKSADSFAERP